MTKQDSSTTGWDPVLLISQVCVLALSSLSSSYSVQIISIQTLHYLTLAILIPPLLAVFAEPSSLDYEGGATNVGMNTFLERQSQ